MTNKGILTDKEGTLTDFALMTEGEHKGKYALRLDDVPYPVLSHVDVFLLRLQKNTLVDVKIKDVNGVKWINKIMKSKKPAPATGTAFTTADKMKESGFGQPTTGPATDEVMSESKAQALKARADAAAAEKAAAQKAAKEQLAHDEEMLKAAKAEEAPAPEGGIPGIVAATKANATRAVPEYPLQNMETPHTTAPGVVVPPGFVLPKKYSDDEMILLRNVIAKGCNEPEFKLLMYMAHEYGLDPLLKQIWAVKRSPDKPALIFVGRDGMLAIAHRSGHFDGMQSGVEYGVDEKGKQIPVSAWCEIWRNDMTHSFKSSVLFSEYAQAFGAWKTHPSAMILKVSEAVGLRKAFVVSGVYDPDEFPAGA